MNLRKLFSLPRSIIINYKLFGFKGLCCPILISNSVRLSGVKRGTIKVSRLRFGVVEIGFSTVEGINKKKELLSSVMVKLSFVAILV